MAQEYKLTHVQIDKEPFVDQHGNTWLTVAFEGISEPVKWVVKDPSRLVVGDSYFGEVNEVTSKAGKPYRRFKKVSQEETNPGKSYTGSTQKKEWQPRDDSAIQAQWAIGQAMSFFTAKSNGKQIAEPEVEEMAKRLFAMIDRVKQGTPTENGSKEDRDEDAEMHRLAAMSEEINLDDIPY